MQLKSLGNLSIATNVIKQLPNDFKNVSNAVKILDKDYLATALAASTLSDAQKIQILINKGLTVEEAKTTLATHALSTSQKGAIGSTTGLGTAFKGLGASIKNATTSMLTFLTTTPVGWLMIAGGAI